MKNQKNLVIFTAIVTIVASIGYILSIIFHLNELREISLAVFGSALLGMIMSLSSYFTSKQEEVNTALSAIDKYADKLLQIEPLRVLIPMPLLQHYLAGKHLAASDKLYKELEESLIIRTGTKRGLSVQDLYLEWVKQTMPEDSNEEMILQESNMRIRDAKEEIDRIMLAYAKMPNLSIEKVKEKMEAIRFFSSQKQKIVDNILKIIKEWTVISNSFSGLQLVMGNNEERRTYYKIGRILKAEENLFDYGEWGKYEYEEDNEAVIFTYRQREVSSKYCKQLIKLEDELFSNELRIWKWIKRKKEEKEERAAIYDGEPGVNKWNALVIIPKQQTKKQDTVDACQ